MHVLRAGSASAYLADGGFGGAVLAASAGGLGSIINPISGYASLGGGLYGAAVGSASGNASRGFQYGELAGGLIGGGLDDWARAVAKGANLLSAASHAARFTAVETGVTGGIGAAAYGFGYDPLVAAQFGQLGGTFAASRFVPCFPAGTPILTPDGSVAIEDLRPGDLVLSRNEHDVDGAIEAKVIEETFTRRGQICELRVAGRVIEITPEHPVYVEHRGWTAAGDVVAGERLSALSLAAIRSATAAISAISAVAADQFWAAETGDLQSLAMPTSAEWLEVESNELTSRVTEVYNFRVADYHTYFVGQPDWHFAIWVHNMYNAPRNAAIDDALESGFLTVKNSRKGAGILAADDHHILTNKNTSGFTREFEELASGAGVRLNDSVNRVNVPGHVGPHGIYNQVVLDRVRQSLFGFQPGSRSYRAKFLLELRSIKRELLQEGSLLNGLVTTRPTQLEQVIFRHPQ